MQNFLRKQAPIAVLALAVAICLPALTQAQIVPLTPVAAPTPASTAAPLLCYDFNRSLKNGSNGEAVRMLQYFLISGEQASIDSSEYGTFGPTTNIAVMAFQQKYASEVLVHVPNQQPTGIVGVATRAKLKTLYGCQNQVVINNLFSPATPTNVSLAVTSILLDSNGVTATFCNNGTNNLPSAPFRIRLNGLNRDFEVLGAQKAGMCDTETLAYSAWGLTYDPGTTFTAIALIDPNNIYRKGTVQVPLTNTSVLNVPAVAGAHLSVRSVVLKSTGVQATFCNLGTLDLTSFPVRVTVNGTAKDFDIAGAYKQGKCVPMTWTYDNWGITYVAGTVYTASIQVDPNNLIKETNEFDNSAIVVGTP
jgi:hypothetical protein